MNGWVCKQPRPRNAQEEEEESSSSLYKFAPRHANSGALGFHARRTPSPAFLPPSFQHTQGAAGAASIPAWCQLASGMVTVNLRLRLSNLQAARADTTGASNGSARR